MRGVIVPVEASPWRAWKRFTAEGSWYYEIIAPGFKYNMTDVAAAIGIHQLRKADTLHRKRTEAAALYARLLEGVEELILPQQQPNRIHSWHLYVVRLKLDRLTSNRAEIIDTLKRYDGTATFFFSGKLLQRKGAAKQAALVDESGFEVANHTQDHAIGNVSAMWHRSYDFDVAESGAVTIAIGDATGHGLRAGTLVTATPTNVNTVSDQFVARMGTSMGVTRHIAASIAWRVEGVPRYDLIGRSDGFRRPGVEMYWEPGVTVSAGRHAISFNVPMGYYYNRFPNPYTGTKGDSTFPEYVAIGTYSVRFGGSTHAAKTPAVSDQPATPRVLPAPGRSREEQQQ